MKPELSASYDDIPGTYLFTASRCREGYHLNTFCMSLLNSKNREAFLSNQEAYLDKYTLTAEQRRCVLEKDWLGMLHVGGNVYYTSKLAATHGLSFQFIAAKMAGVSQDEYRKMMIDGGRSPDGNRSKKEKI